MARSRGSTVDQGRLFGVPATYHPQALTFYAGNPLIEALPPLRSEEEAERQLRRVPAFEQEYRELPAHLRYHVLLEIAGSFFEPLTAHLALDQQFGGLIRAGYRDRNPIVPGHWPRTKAKVDALLGLLARRRDGKRRPTPRLTFIGLSGTGKTTSIRQIFGLYDQVVRHSRYQGKLFTHTQVVWLHLQCPRNGALSVLVRSFFQELDRVLGSQYCHQYLDRARRPVEAFILDMANLAAVHSLGVLVIDEIQNLVEARGVDKNELLNFLVELDESMGIPIVLVGTPEAQEVLGSKFRRARRAGGVGPVDWDRLAEDEEWDYFVNRLWPYQVVRHATPTPTPDLVHALYVESQGILDIAVKVFLLAQMHAIAAGPDPQTQREGLDARLFRTASVVSLRMVQPFLAALRTHDQARLAHYRDISFEPLTIDDLTHVHDVYQQERAQHPPHPTDVQAHDEDLPQAIPSQEVNAKQDVNAKPDQTPTASKRQKGQARSTRTSDAAQPALESDNDAPLLVRLFEESRAARASVYSFLGERGLIASTAAFLEELVR